MIQKLKVLVLQNLYQTKAGALVLAEALLSHLQIGATIVVCNLQPMTR